MKPLVLIFGWILLLVAQSLIVPVFTAPIKSTKREKDSRHMSSTVMTTSRARHKTNSVQTRLTKSPSNAGKSFARFSSSFSDQTSYQIPT